MYVYAVLDLDQHEQVLGLFTDAHHAIGAALDQGAGEPVVHALTAAHHEAGYVFVATPRYSGNPERASLRVKRLEVL